MGPGTEPSDAPRPGFPVSRTNTAHWNLAIFPCLLKTTTARLFGGLKPVPWQKWPPQLKCGAKQGPQGEGLWARESWPSIPSLGPNCIPFLASAPSGFPSTHNRPGARYEVWSAFAASSLPTSELNSFSLRTETFLSRTILTPYPKQQDFTSRSTDANDPQRSQKPPTKQHISELDWLKSLTSCPLRRKRHLSSALIGHISRQSNRSPASPATPLAL